MTGERSSFSLAQGQTAADAAILIVILMGALLFVFSSFEKFPRLKASDDATAIYAELSAHL